MKRLHEIYDYAVFLPVMFLSVVAEHGPSWKEIASYVAGGAFTMMIGVGGYWLASQDKAISDLRSAYNESRITMVSLRASVDNLKESTEALKDEIDYERAKREAREAEERADLRAAKDKK